MKYLIKKQTTLNIEADKPKDKLIKKLHTKVNQALAAKDLDQAETLAFKLSRLSNIPETFLKYAHILFIQRKYDQAEVIYQDLYQTVENSLKAEVLFGLGQVYYEKSGFSSSHFFFTLLVNNFPSFDCLGMALFKLAKIMIKFKEYDVAFSYCDKIQSLEQQKICYKSEALALMGNIQLSKGKNSEASELYKKALAASPSIQSLKLTIFGFIRLNPRFAETLCIKAMKKEIELKEWHKFYFLLGLCYVKTGKYEKARRCFEEIRKVETTNYLVQEFYAISLFYNGEKKESLKCLQSIELCFPFDELNSKNVQIVCRNLQGFVECQENLEIYSNSDKVRNTRDSIKLLKPSITIFDYPCSDE